jgi:phosphate-selective porin OprO/OprP
MKIPCLVAAFLVSTSLTAPSAAAADTTAALAKEIETLRNQLNLLQKQLEALQARETVAVPAQAITAAPQKEAPPAPKVTQSATNRFALASADGAWTIAPTGRIHMDMGVYLNQKAEGTTGPGTAAGGRLTSGVNARRARLGVTGRALNDFAYTFILDAGGAQDSEAHINEARIFYNGLRNTVFEIGYGSQYFPLDEANSSNDIVFMERPTPVTIAASFNAGDPRFSAGVRHWESNWFVGAYLTAGVPNSSHALTERGFGAYQRFTYNPVQTDSASVHIGVSAAQVFDVPDTGPNTADSFSLGDRPEIRIDPTNLLSTGPLGTTANPVTAAQVYGVEAVGAFGALYLQGEYFRDVVKRRQGPAVNVGGGYAAASYAIGGRRTYIPASGAYSGINPTKPFSPKNGGWGAFEFAARVSYMDLVDHYSSSVLAADQPFMVNGGRQTNYTLGFNWFWNSNMLWKLNYFHTEFDKAGPISATSALPIPLGLSLDTLAARFQVMF